MTTHPKRLGAVALFAACAVAHAYDLPPPPPPLFEGLMVPLFPHGMLEDARRQTDEHYSRLNRNLEAARNRDATLSTAPSQAAATARQLATAFPAAQRAQMSEVYLQSLDVYLKLAQKLGVPSNDVAGALAAYIAGNYMALHNVEVPDAHFQRLVAQMRDTLSERGSFVGASALQKRQIYEQLAMVGTFMAMARQAFLQNPNPASEQNFRNAARANLASALGQPAERLRITERGLSLQ